MHSIVLLVHFEFISSPASEWVSWSARECAAEVLGRFSLGSDADRLVRTYSGGMKRRLDLAASLVGRPDVLLLDEPNTGIDPRSRLEVWALIRDLVAPPCC